MIHLYPFQDQNILLDVGSGAVHMVSDVVFDILSVFSRVSARGAIAETETRMSERDAWERAKPSVCAVLCDGRHPLRGGSGDGDVHCAPANAGRPLGVYARGDLEDAMREIDALAANDMLFFEDVPQETASPEQRGAVIKAMCLHVAHDCNMRCAYCFGDEGSFSGERALLPAETGRKAIDFLIAHSGNRHNLEIEFFGGEPLMNFETVKELVRYGKERAAACGKHIRFTLTTNGLLLDEEKERFINEHMDNVILSIDGRPEVNDRMRKTPAGGGTYQHVIDNIARFRENRQGLYYVRGTFTAKNKDFSEDVKHLADMGFEHVSVEPVVTEPDRDYALKESDIPELLAEYDKLTDLYLDYARNGKKFSFFHFDVDLTQGPCVYKRVAGCGAGTEYVAVSPEGDIYPCHRFVGEEQFKLGNVRDEAFENKWFSMFNRAHIYNKEDCSACWAKFYCSGGCHANAWSENGDMLKPYGLGCALEKKRLECAIGIQAVLQSSTETNNA
jgi:uncharacterized protein